jgi:hypothetical protein
MSCLITFLDCGAENCNEDMISEVELKYVFPHNKRRNEARQLPLLELTSGCDIVKVMLRIQFYAHVGSCKVIVQLQKCIAASVSSWNCSQDLFSVLLRPAIRPNPVRLSQRRCPSDL